jgi:hypothetical protein
MKKIQVNVQTGETFEIDLTPEEIEELTLQAQKNAEQQEQLKIKEAREALLKQLSDIDAKTVRPLRAILAAQAQNVQPNIEDISYLANLNEQAAIIRSKL